MTAAENSATPRPWVARYWPADEFTPGRKLRDVVGANDEKICLTGMSLSMGHGHMSEPEANTELLVRAVNSHDALVDALKELLRFLDDATLAELQNPSKYRPCISARAALARATAE